MGSTPSRPLGLTLVAVLVILQGVLAIIAGLNLLGVVSLLALPASGSPGATGAAMLIAGVLNVIVGIGLFTYRFWAYVIAIVVLGMTVFAGMFALVQHGLDSQNLSNLVPALIAAVVAGYLLSDRVRPYFDS